jgi:type II secretory pathway pseudopilin PulG
LLVVIAIIGILAAMLMPALAKARVKAQVQRARVEMASIIQAINGYQAAYSRLPVSRNVLSDPAAANDDFTYGTYGVPTPKVQITDMSTHQAANITSPNFTYQTNNAEVMAILMDKEFFPYPNTPQRPTLNLGHVENPQKVAFLNAAMAVTMTAAGQYTPLPGVGSDLIYRDPWANPYIISFNVKNDDMTRDAFYRSHVVSQANGAWGLVNPKANPATDDYEFSGQAMVWSAGPDKAINSGLSATLGANIDNVLSWKP